VNARNVVLPDAWNDAIRDAARHAAARLGILDGRVEAKLYKMLIYEKGGFFLPHRDSEKRKKMVASLVVMLPGSFGGGELVVEHADSKNTFAFEQAARGEATQYVAFYADCRHEVRRVTRGVRVCLHYNLIVKPPARRTRVGQPDQADEQLTEALSHWVKTRPGEPLVFALEHQYTSDGLQPDLLKGNDRVAASQWIKAAEAADCRAYFGQVSRHLLQYADDGRYERGRFGRRARVNLANLHIGETYEDDVTVDGWKDSQGKRIDMGALPLDGSSLVSPVPFQQWIPTTQDYEGYTGNAGNTIDRWYHKSAIVIWANADHFDVVVKMGIRTAIDAWLQMREALPQLSGTKLEQATQDSQLLARAIVEAWPDRRYRHRPLEKEDRPWLARFANTLPTLQDVDLLREFLRTVARRDWQLRLHKVVLDGCRQLGSDTMAALLTDYLSTTPPPDSYRYSSAPELPARDAAWLCKLATSRNQGGLSSRQLSELCRLEASRFRAQMATQARYQSHPLGGFASVLADLLQAALAAGDEHCFGELLDLKRSMPKVFGVRAFDAEVTTTLVKWADQQFDERPDLLASWLAETRHFLEVATAEPPTRPRDHARPNATDCDCPRCQELAQFLADPQASSGAIKGLKDRLLHVQAQIREQQLDAESRIDRTTRPFTLLLTKTSESHTRAVNQYHADQKLLSKLPPAH
jgi:hypothetical protein